MAKYVAVDKDGSFPTFLFLAYCVGENPQDVALRWWGQTPLRCC